MFPRGIPGIALLLLRASVAMALLVVMYLRDDGLAAWLLAGAWALAILLVVGYLTPLVAILAIAAQVLNYQSLVGPFAACIAVSALNALALALLGPGAYSIDATRFGRRVVALPPVDDG